MERDEEVDLDLEAGAKLLTGQNEDLPRRKSKSKAKKKDDGDLVKPASKTLTALPLSLAPPTAEDRAQYEVRLSAQKNQLHLAKEYKVSIRFKVGDTIQHKTFGTGFVVAEGGLNKIEVLFAQGRKLLVSGI